jgi:hypothetical protein
MINMLILNKCQLIMLRTLCIKQYTNCGVWSKVHKLFYHFNMQGSAYIKILFSGVSNL